MTGHEFPRKIFGEISGRLRDPGAGPARWKIPPGGGGADSGLFEPENGGLDVPATIKGWIERGAQNCAPEDNSGL